MSTVAALGIGGTNFHYAAGTTGGELLTPIWTDPTDPDNLTAQVTDAITDVQERTSRELEAVSIACKGLIDRQKGVIEYIDIQNGQEIYDINLQQTIKEQFGLPLYLENDCTAAVLGEYYFGAGQAYSTLVHITIGTGIGSGIIDDGKLVHGETGFAGEIGSIQVGPMDGLECFGIPGAWEAYCSGPGIQQFVQRRLSREDRDTKLRRKEELSPQCIFETAKEGDTIAEEYLDTIARYNAVGFGTVCNLYNPGLITLGGGVALNNYSYLMNGINDHLGNYLVVDKPDFQLAELGGDLGVYGGLALLKHLEERPDRMTVALS